MNDSQIETLEQVRQFLNGAAAHLGYHHIAQKWAPLINEFNQKYLNPYINYWTVPSSQAELAFE